MPSRQQAAGAFIQPAEPLPATTIRGQMEQCSLNLFSLPGCPRRMIKGKRECSPSRQGKQEREREKGERRGEKEEEGREGGKEKLICLPRPAAIHLQLFPKALRAGKVCLKMGFAGGVLCRANLSYNQEKGEPQIISQALGMCGPVITVWLGISVLFLRILGFAFGLHSSHFSNRKLWM